MRYGNVLVTGGAGFLGSQLVKKLKDICNHLYIIDDLSTGNAGAIPRAKNITFYKESITNNELLESILPKVEVIFHLACRNVVLSVENIDEDFNTNLYGGFLLLKKAKECCPNLQKFVYTSTSSIYGDASILPTPESYHNITLPYSASKFSTEHYCRMYYHMYNLPITILRLSNVYGPGQLASNPYCGVIAKFFDAIKKKEPLTIYSDGTQTRDFTYVEDTIRAILMAGISERSIGKVYNIGTGKETSIIQLAKTILEIKGDPHHPIISKPKRAVDKVHRRALHVEEIEKELGWKALISLQQGLVLTSNWLQAEGLA